MTEQRAAYEAATLESMHTQAGVQPWAVNVAEHVDGDDYTWAGPSYPAVPAPAADNARLRSQITDLHSEYSAQIATLELRVRELERDNARLRSELQAWNTIPAEALIAYWQESVAASAEAEAAEDTVGDWINELRHGVNVGRYYAGLEPL